MRQPMCMRRPDAYPTELDEQLERPNDDLVLTEANIYVSSEPELVTRIRNRLC